MLEALVPDWLTREVLDIALQSPEAFERALVVASNALGRSREELERSLRHDFEASVLAIDLGSRYQLQSTAWSLLRHGADHTLAQWSVDRDAEITATILELSRDGMPSLIVPAVRATGDGLARLATLVETCPQLAAYVVGTSADWARFEQDLAGSRSLGLLQEGLVQPDVSAEAEAVLAPGERCAMSGALA